MNGWHRLMIITMLALKTWTKRNQIHMEKIMHLLRPLIGQ